MAGVNEIKDEELKKLVLSMEKDLLSLIVFHLKKKKISVEVSRKIAGGFLSILPVEDKKELFDRLAELSKKYPEIRDIYLKHGVPFLEEEKEKILTVISQHMSQEELQKTLKEIKGGK